MQEQYLKYSDARPARAVTILEAMKGFIIDSRIPSGSLNNDKHAEFRSAVVELKDLYVNNMNDRFSDKNKTLWKSMQALCPSGSEFFVSSQITPLYEYALKISAFKMNKTTHSATRLNSELIVFKNINFLMKTLTYLVSTNL